MLEIMNINYDKLENDLKNQDLQSLYLLYGDEKYLIELALNKIKRKFGELILGINFIVIDENNVEDLISNIETPAFMRKNLLL